MFENAPEILLTLQIETMQKFSGRNDPLLLGTELFCTALKNLPAETSADYPYPGIFGLGSVTPEVREAWKKRIAAAGRNQPEFSSIPAEFLPLAEVGCHVDDGGRGHTNIDFGEVLQKGLKSIWKRLAAGESDFEKCACKTLLAVKDFAAKYGCSVPWEPAGNFDEALQSIWLVYECIIISEIVPYSYSWGRMDQYLLPYAADLTEHELTEKLARFFRFLNEVNFTDDASALNVGGQEGFNRLSRAIIAAVEQNRMPSPMLTVRVHEKLPDEDWALILRPGLLAYGQPTLYGEEACRTALQYRGIQPEHISQWAVNSCMGLVIPGKEWQDMWGAVLPLTLALELTLNQGHFFKEKTPFETTVEAKELTDYAVLYQQLLEYTKTMFAAAVAANRKRCKEFMEHFQNVFVSLFYDDCISRRKEVRNGGIQYHTMTVETMGLVNLADSLVSIQKLVFEEKKYTLAELTEALKNNFATAPQLLADIAKLPKFGENGGFPEAVLQQLAEDIADIADQFSTDEFFCAPSLHTLTKHIDYGLILEATADGRRAGEPLAKNAGTSPSVKTAHTSLILAASSWNQPRFSGGQPLDLWIAANDWHDPEQVNRYAALFRTYFKRGGLQIQVNGADPAELRQAMEHPEKYGHLIVRIGGFSVRFTALQRKAQEDYLLRFANGM